MGKEQINIVCALYARISVSDHGYDESIDHQLSLLKEYAKQKNLVVKDEFIYEEIISATTTSIWQRPAMKKLIEDAKQGKFQTVLFKGISRLARNTQEALELLDRFKQLNIRVISFEENFDSSRDDSTFLFGIHALLAQQEAEKLGVRVRLGMKEVAKKGEWQGKVPLGYDLVDKKLVVNEEEAKIVRLMFDLYVNKRMGSLKLVDYLNSHGLKTKSGKLWSRRTVLGTLKNKVYLGIVEYNKVKKKKVRDYESTQEGKMKWVLEPNDPKDWIVVENSHEPLIDKQTFMEAQRLMKSRSVRSEPRNVKYPLIGLLYCGNCGKKFTARKNGKYFYYNCLGRVNNGKSFCDQGSVSMKKLDSFILEQLKLKLDKVKDKIKIDPSILEVNKEQTKKRLEKINKDIEKIKKKTADLYFEKENLEEQQYQYILDRLKNELKKLNDEKDTLEIQLKTQEQTEDKNKLIQQYIDEFFQMDQQDLKQVRKVFHRFIEKVVLYDDNIDIYYTFNF